MRSCSYDESSVSRPCSWRWRHSVVMNSNGGVEVSVGGLLKGGGWHLPLIRPCLCHLVDTFDVQVGMCSRIATRVIDLGA